MRREHQDPEYQPDMPPVDAEYLVWYLFEIGPTLSAGGYPGPITHEELQAWQANTGVVLQSWELRFLHRLSREYLAETVRAAKECPAPTRMDESPTVAASRVTQQALRDLAKL